MGTKFVIYGGPDLEARLSSISDSTPDLVAQWAADAAERMKQSAPHSTRAESRSFTPKARGLRGAVYGAYWWIFVDRGVKRHDIFGSGGKNPPDSLKFSVGGRTIFAKKVDHPGQRARPFITIAAQQALASSRLANFIVEQWNLRRHASHARFL